MRIVGFASPEEPHAPASKAPERRACLPPVPSLVSVRFDSCNKALTYYNDLFALKTGDRVFVSGKYAKEVGTVDSVTTKFRIRLSDYEKVISLAQTPVQGTYRPVLDKMVSTDADAVSPEDFKTWFLPPDTPADDPENVIVSGEGWEIPLDDLTGAEDSEQAVFDRAVRYCNEGKVAYVSVRNGIGKAFVEGSQIYELDFRLNGRMLTEGYCGCPYPRLCKHLLAVALTLSVFTKTGAFDPDGDFVIIDPGRLFYMIRHSGQTITVGSTDK